MRGSGDGLPLGEWVGGPHLPQDVRARTHSDPHLSPSAWAALQGALQKSMTLCERHRKRANLFSTPFAASEPGGEGEVPTLSCTPAAPSQGPRLGQAETRAQGPLARGLAPPPLQAESPDLQQSKSVWRMPPSLPS